METTESAAYDALGRVLYFQEGLRVCGALGMDAAQLMRRFQPAPPPQGLSYDEAGEESLAAAESAEGAYD